MRCGGGGKRQEQGSHLLAQDPDDVVGQGDAEGEEEDQARHQPPRELRWLHGPCLPVPVTGQVPTHGPTQRSCRDGKRFTRMSGSVGVSGRCQARALAPKGVRAVPGRPLEPQMQQDTKISTTATSLHLPQGRVMCSYVCTSYALLTTMLDTYELSGSQGASRLPYLPLP